MVFKLFSPTKSGKITLERLFIELTTKLDHTLCMVDADVNLEKFSWATKKR
jgi:hypothetical protein